MIPGAINIPVGQLPAAVHRGHAILVVHTPDDRNDRNRRCGRDRRWVTARLTATRRIGAVPVRSGRSRVPTHWRRRML